jgi:hypothetical protein
VQVTSAGGSNFKVAVEAVSGTKPFYLDNAALMGAQLSSAQKAGTMGALAPPTGWTTGGVLLNDPPNAHTGKAYMTVAGALVSSQWNEAGVVPGQTYAGSAWVKAPAGYSNSSSWIALYTLNADDSILDSYQVTPKPVPGGDWLEVPLTLPVTHQGVKTLSLVILNSDPTHPLYVDDVNISRDGLSIVDPWSVSGNTGLVSLSNPSVAHSGNGYLQITTQGGAGSALLSSTVTPTTGARTFATWVKSATSGSVAGTLTLKAGSRDRPRHGGHIRQPHAHDRAVRAGLDPGR